ncbi:HD domain-containing protein [Kytococcus sp. Marseille-QA3725]
MPALIAWWSQDVQALAPDAPGSAVVDAGARLLACWTEPHRAYHSTRHLVEMFWALEELQEAGEVEAEEARTLRMAAWFHDAVYDATAAAGENERASAGLARAELTGLGVSPTVVDEVERLVLLTFEHRAEKTDRSGRAFSDVDLWILSADADRYAEYTRQVRREYAHVPEELFRRGRRAVLEHLGEGTIYTTPHALREWEPRARRNLERELATLG